MSAVAQMTFIYPAQPPLRLSVPFVTRIPRLPEKFMLRTLVLVAAFFGITLALILLQPVPDLHSAEREHTVTRANTDTSPALAVPAATFNATQSQPARVSVPSVPAIQGPAGDPEMQAMTRGVLTGLGIAPASLDGGTDAEAALRDMSLSALNGLRSVTGQQASAETPLQSLIVQALRAGQTDSYIDTLLNEAANMGEIAVPRALITADGRVDTHVILSTIVAQATKASGKPEAALAAPGGAGVEVRTVQRAGESVQYNFYTIGPGDSLGAIAAKFYGDAARYNHIFEANRALLSSPDKLRVGQRLVIPRI